MTRFDVIKSRLNSMLTQIKNSEIYGKIGNVAAYITIVIITIMFKSIFMIWHFYCEKICLGTTRYIPFWVYSTNEPKRVLFGKCTGIGDTLYFWTKNKFTSITWANTLFPTPKFCWHSGSNKKKSVIWYNYFMNHWDLYDGIWWNGP